MTTEKFSEESKSTCSGIKTDAGKPRMELLSNIWLKGVAQVLTFGAHKYSDHQWRNGIVQSRLIGAALRHILAYLDGEDLDTETGLSHLSHASCELMFAAELAVTRPDLDDRYRVKIPSISQVLADAVSPPNVLDDILPVPEKQADAPSEAPKPPHNLPPEVVAEIERIYKKPQPTGNTMEPPFVQGQRIAARMEMGLPFFPATIQRIVKNSKSGQWIVEVKADSGEELVTAASLCKPERKGP